MVVSSLVDPVVPTYLDSGPSTPAYIHTHTKGMVVWCDQQLAHITFKTISQASNKNTPEQITTRIRQEAGEYIRYESLISINAGLHISA